MTRPEVHPPQYPRQLEIVCRNDADSLTLSVCGEIDLASAPILERALREAERPGRRIVLDLAGLEFIDSTGIHVLMDAQHRAELNGHKVILTHVAGQAERLFTLTGISAQLSIA